MTTMMTKTALQTVKISWLKPERLWKKKLPQVVSMAIVHSFTEHNNHPKLNSMVPVIFMDGTDVQIVLYDCVQDVLLLSAKVKYSTQNAGPCGIVGCVAGN